MNYDWNGLSVGNGPCISVKGLCAWNAAVEKSPERGAADRQDTRVFLLALSALERFDSDMNFTEH